MLAPPAAAPPVRGHSTHSIPKLFADVNVLEVLRVGLSGLCFLLSLLAFWLIWREQGRQGSPRKGILRTIYVFMAVNLLTALLVGVAGYLTPHPQPFTASGLAPVSWTLFPLGAIRPST